MDEIEQDLTKEEKEFLLKRLGDAKFLRERQLDGYERYPVRIRMDDDAFGEQVGWKEIDELCDMFYFNRFMKGVTNNEAQVFSLCDTAARGDGDTGAYVFQQCLTLLYRRQQVGDTRLIYPTEQDVRFLIKCAQHAKEIMSLTLSVFTFDVNKQLGQYLQDPGWKTKAECYRRYYVDQGKQKIIAADLGISQSTAAKYVDEVQGRLSLEMGQAYEDFFEKTAAPRKYDRYVRMGAKGAPDGVGYKGDIIEVISLKCHQVNRNSDTIHRSGLTAEIEYAKKLLQESNKNVKVKLVYHELIRNLDIERDVDIFDESQKITINFSQGAEK